MRSMHCVQSPLHPVGLCCWQLGGPVHACEFTGCMCGCGTWQWEPAPWLGAPKAMEPWPQEKGNESMMRGAADAL